MMSVAYFVLWAVIALSVFAVWVTAEHIFDRNDWDD